MQHVCIGPYECNLFTTFTLSCHRSPVSLQSSLSIVDPDMQTRIPDNELRYLVTRVHSAMHVHAPSFSSEMETIPKQGLQAHIRGLYSMPKDHQMLCLIKSQRPGIISRIFLYSRAYATDYFSNLVIKCLFVYSFKYGTCPLN